MLNFFRLLEMIDSITEEMKLEELELSISYSNLDVGIVQATTETFRGASFVMNKENRAGRAKSTMVGRTSWEFTKWDKKKLLI